MSEWLSLFSKPDDLDDGPSAEAWFTRIARRILNGCRLMIGNQPHRFAEIEFYYFGDAHPDVFTHKDPIQLEGGRWYFHRTNGVYRGGSFKGMDLAFGDGEAHAGALIRSITKPDGSLVNGPSLCVDHLLDATGSDTIAVLDKSMDGKLAWEKGNPLLLVEAEEEDTPLYRTARVGLSLKRMRNSPQPPRYIMRPYRYTNEPRRISKGKTHLVLALHAQGLEEDEINRITGCARSTIKRYVQDFEEGALEADLSSYFGIDLPSKELCRLHGTWNAKFGPASFGQVEV